ncbi:MAG: CIA30 family protein [Opitutaceae bacterium]|jgi:monofunctional biosynthetic peptidoglycan transglycosylase|nr:CIA30 family protein [Opitutaceae bacterium]
MTPLRPFFLTLLSLFAAPCLFASPAAGESEPAGRPPGKGLVLFDFSAPGAGDDWRVVNDDVMGGVSRSDSRTQDGSLHFHGVLSLENNGGFASVRRRTAPRDLGPATHVVLRVKGDGRTYRLQLGTSAQFRRSRIAYQAEFATRAGEWIEARVPLASLVPTYRGENLSGPPLDHAGIEEFGFLLADGRAGAFALEVAWMRAE